MRRYETIVILRPSLGEADSQAVIDRATEIIKNFEGSIIKIDKWGLKKLAYLIKKEAQGYYVYIDYAAVPSAVAEIERIFKIDDRLLKYMTLKLADSCDPAAILEEMAKGAAKKAAEATESEDDEAVAADSKKPAAVAATDD